MNTLKIKARNEKQQGCYRILDANGRAVGHVYGTDYDDARRVAMNSGHARFLLRRVR